MQDFRRILLRQELRLGRPSSVCSSYSGVPTQSIQGSVWCVSVQKPYRSRDQKNKVRETITISRRIPRS